MYERLTDRARRVVALAEDEARRLSHNHVGTEHLLLGLIDEGDGVAARTLESLGVSLAAVRQQVEMIIGQGREAPRGRIPYTPRARKALELSLREALQLGHHHIGTEHILLGLVREGKGAAAQMLVKLGADLNRVRQQVIQLLDAEGAQQPETIPAVRRLSLAGGSERKLLSEVLGRVELIDSRLSAVERHVGTGPDVGVDLASLAEGLHRLGDEVRRLRGLLRQQGIEPQHGAA
jgi:ATP-dependent Clp protease ATP-binding subunit ClpC